MFCNQMRSIRSRLPIADPGNWTSPSMSFKAIVDAGAIRFDLLLVHPEVEKFGGRSISRRAFNARPFRFDRDTLLKLNACWQFA